MKFGKGGKQTFLLCVALFVLAFCVYLPALKNDFVHYDDPLYVTGNNQVRNGLTWEGIRWAFHSSVAANWHPITMLSHMVDCQLFGLDPRGHHGTSVLFHSLNAALLFFLLQRITGTTWRSFLVALIFALHPLRVESVAWVSERKDVLSTFFGLLSLLAYAGYVSRVWCRASIEDPNTNLDRNLNPSPLSAPPRSHALRYYVLSLLFFALGLMSKPMLVTWPCVMLLLDYWPLRRFGATSNVQSSMFKVRCSKFVFLFRDKLPFFALTIAASIVTFLVQRAGGAVETIERLPLAMRIQNAVVAYVCYLEKFFWPDNLSVVYLYPTRWPFGEVFVCGALLLGISILVFLSRRTHPYAVTGWLWFVGTLVPVIGLLQVGERLMADRYTYIPLIGIAIIFAWLTEELLRPLRNTNPVRVVLTVAVMASCIVLTLQQISYWKDGENLFRRAIVATKDNYVAHLSLGLALASKHRYPEAITEYREALRLRPDYTRAHGHLAVALANTSKLDEALPEFEKAAQIEPTSPRAHYNLGAAYLQTRRLDQAIFQFREALKLDPSYAEAHCNLGVALITKGQTDEAIAQFREALRLRPGYPDAQRNLQRALKASSPNPP